MTTNTGVGTLSLRWPIFNTANGGRDFDLTPLLLREGVREEPYQTVRTRPALFVRRLFTEYLRDWERARHFIDRSFKGNDTRPRIF